MFVNHLLVLLAHCPHARHIWLAYFRAELPGMPRGWYARYAGGLIREYPYQMNAILHHRPSSL